MTTPQQTGRSALREIAAATPASRDRYVDFLRAFSICVVVLGHWLIAAIYWRGGEVSGVNALEVVPGIWIATWVLQVMPLFFFVGGFSNLVTVDSISRRGGGYSEYIYGRVARLMRPTAIFLAVWIPLAIVIDVVTRLDDDLMDSGTTLLTRPLWFIGIYLIMIAFAPPMIRLHRRFGLRVVLAMAAGAVLVDLLDIGLGVRFIGYLNFGFVWLLVHQLGFFYGDGTITKLPRPVFWGMALGGLMALLLLTGPGSYSPAMVGLVGERSNTNPPTIAIIALTVWQIGLAMILRSSLSRWLNRIRVWMGVVWISAVIMTMFLWHQTAMLVAVGILYPLGFPQPVVGSASWWLLRPVWVISLAVVLSVLVLLFGRFERGRGRAEETPTAESGAKRLFSALGVSYVLLGILGLAVGGMDAFAARSEEMLVFLEVNPLQNLLHLLIGAFLLRAAVGETRRGAYAGLAALSLVGLAGILVPGGNELLAVNMANSAMHLASAASLGVVLLLPDRRNGKTAGSAVSNFPV